MPHKYQPSQQRDDVAQIDLQPCLPSAARVVGPDPPEEASRLHDLALASRGQGRYAEAAAHALQALAV
jgi:Tetratricopeptide repeat